jgi:hypothetical protein
MNDALLARDRASWERSAAALKIEGRAFIDGRYVAARSGRVFDDISPIDGKVIGQVARCEAADVDAAVAAARASFEGGAWRRSEPRQRKRVLLRFAELIRADIERLALLETLDVGKPMHNSINVDVPNCADCIAYYAEFADKLVDEIAPTGPDDLALIRREPLGVIGAIVPWNYPLIISAWKIGPALLAGNSVVLKPAEQSPARRHPPGRAGARSRAAARRAQRRARFRRGGRQAAGAAPGRRHDQLHRLDRGRQADDALCRRVQSQARGAGTGRQEPAPGDGGRGPGAGGRRRSPGASITTPARPATPARA